MKALTIITVLFFSTLTLFAQNKDKGKFVEYEPGFYQNSILKDVNAINENLKPIKKEKHFFMDHSDLSFPSKLSDYTIIWHSPSHSQGNAGTCWCYGGTSFFESEAYRLYNKEVRISEIHTVYWEYVEKAKQYVRTRGNSEFSQGSQANAVTRMFDMYGAVPETEYTGLLHGRKYHSHDAMFNEMMNYLKSVKNSNAWNEELVVATIKSILNHYLGEPPSSFKYEGKEYTPKTWLSDYLKINTENYIDILSIMQEPEGENATYPVPDNWWNSDTYYNVKLDEFMNLLNKALQNGYSLAIGGDVSESGFVRNTQAAAIPDYDIPSEYINDYARQFRFSNKSTTDDHIMHIVGYKKHKGDMWYLVKDSSSGSRNNNPEAAEFGYYFFHEDYIKLKILTFTVHKDLLEL
ncbi:MAG: C1 family peptidase [Bacteroidales bacterium]|nr:C1 family peptidase [Bacteroidales bacterium]